MLADSLNKITIVSKLILKTILFSHLKDKYKKCQHAVVSKMFNGFEKTRESQSADGDSAFLSSVFSTFANKYKNIEFHSVIFGLKLYNVRYYS